MTQLDASEIKRDGAEPLRFAHHLVGRDEEELCLGVDELRDQPGAGDSVHLDMGAGDPFHGRLSFKTRSGRGIA